MANGNGVTDIARRTGRTAIQGGIAGGIVALLTSFHVVHLTADQTTAIIVVGTPFVTFLQNWIEKKTGIDIGIPKTPTDPTADPNAPDPNAPPTDPPAPDPTQPTDVPPTPTTEALAPGKFIKPKRKGKKRPR